MPIYTGTGTPGDPDFQMEEFEGFFTNPDNPDEWSSEPYPLQKKAIRRAEILYEYMSDNQCTFKEVYEQVKSKTCTLSKSMRDYVVETMELKF